MNEKINNIVNIGKLLIELIDDQNFSEEITITEKLYIKLVNDFLLHE